MEVMKETVTTIIATYPWQLATTALAVVLLFGFLHNEDRRVALPNNVAQLAATERAAVTNDVLDAVADIMLLPDRVDPIVATIADSKTVRAQRPFYAKVEDGDVQIVFQLSQYVVIYRPSTHQIVNAGPLTWTP